MIGKEMYKWLTDLFPIYRCLTGEGVRETLTYLKNIVPEIQIHSVKSGTKAFDWVVPQEWRLIDAFIIGEDGEKIVDIKDSNLHVWGYSISVNEELTLDDLKNKIVTIEELPDAIPYVTCYYKKDWGFCMAYNKFKKLKDQKYKVVIESVHFDGVLNYGEIVLKGRTSKEVLLSTYICHPSMANNELSGPVVAIALAKYLKNNILEHTYRILFLPETIGPVVYLSQNNNLNYLKSNVIAGFQLTCCGDNKCVSYLPSRIGNTYTDIIARYVLENYIKDYKEYSFLERGSDERQWCSPNVNLPIVSLMRSKYHEFVEYHTSFDNLSFVSPDGLLGGYENVLKCIKIIEINHVYKNISFCEPQMGKRKLYPNISLRNDNDYFKKNLMNLLMYIDGENDLLKISQILKIDIFELKSLADILIKEELITN